MAPYATVILPTFDRSSTLPLALASVQGQTERSLEIVVVLDGATAACREAAMAVAGSDQRLTVLDLPNNHSANLDLAVSQARAERIFYIDDDDLWRPDHIARLGPLLDQADVADSRTCSVDLSGGLNLSPCRGSNPRIRELLGSYRCKLLYDTHVGHRKDAHGRIARWRSDGEAGVPVWDFLADLAKHPVCRWASCDAVTALSLHGAARRDMTAEDRAAELALWRSQLHDLDETVVRADSTFHLFRLLLSDPPDPREETFGGYLAGRGGYTDALWGQHENDLFSLFTSEPPGPEAARALATRLSEPVESGHLFEALAAAYFRAYGQEEHERILKDVAALEGHNKGSRLAAYSVALVRRDIAEALQVARLAVAAGPDSIGGLARWCEGLALMAGGSSEQAHC